MSESTAPAPVGDVVVTKGLRKTFESEGAPVRALRGVDFTMHSGEFVAVMGPSGCGKSTLLNLVAGLDTPTDGEISLAGESLVGKSEDELAIMRRRHIGIVFQFFNLLEGMSVLENVTLPAVIAGAPRKRAETRPRPARPARSCREGERCAGCAVWRSAPAARNRACARQRADAWCSHERQTLVTLDDDVAADRCRSTVTVIVVGGGGG